MTSINGQGLRSPAGVFKPTPAAHPIFQGLRKRLAMPDNHPPLVEAAIESAYKATQYLAVIAGRMNCADACRVALKAKNDLSALRSPRRVQEEEAKKGLV